jgi:hypothetical protein
MSKRLFVVFALVVFAGALNCVSAANDKPQTWKGVVTLLCAAPPDGSVAAPAGDACRFALVTPSDKKVFVLDPQARLAKYAKHTVTVTGTLSGAAKIKMATIDGVVEASTIQVASITPASGS